MGTSETLDNKASGTTARRLRDAMGMSETAFLPFTVPFWLIFNRLKSPAKDEIKGVNDRRMLSLIKFEFDIHGINISI